ncbi:triose-phosphate transporter family-domain-containing protein, partial [Pavlovales sp. CCMP2436]
MVLFYFGVWYVINVAYNYTNKKALQVLPLPCLMAAAQIGAGILYITPVWLLGIRAPPKLETKELLALVPVGMIHGVGQLVTVLSLQAGSISFVNVVKSLEPFFNVIFAMIFMHDYVPLPVLLTLVPVVVGVGIASSADMEFTWLCFACAMGSNVFFSLRGVLSKVTMKAIRPESNLGPANLFGVLTIIGFLTSLPLALWMEGGTAQAQWDRTVAAGQTPTALAKTIAISGLSFYMYNEVSMLALDAVDPVTHAVGNTIKRVILILLSVVAFGTQMTNLSAIGSTIAIIGVFMYSI